MPKVYFVGCGPGDPDLITIKAKKLIQKADVVVYSGSLIPPQILKMCKNAKMHDASKLVREEIFNLLKENVKKGKNVIFDIDWQGTEQIKQKKPNYKLITFFILPPSRKVLFDRLSNRDMKDKLIVEERMKQFDKDLLHWKKYDFVAINNDLETCYNQIVEIIKAKLNQTIINYDQQFIENHIKKLTQ